MTLKRISVEQVHHVRNALEVDLLAVVSKEMRAWLADVRGAVLRAVDSPSPVVLLAAAGDEMPPMGTLAGMWAARVDAAVVQAVRAALTRAFARWTDQVIEASPAMETANAYLASVRDRLVQGTHFGVPVYEDAFDKIRKALAASNAEGWTRPELAQRIAAELSWETAGPYWRSELARVDGQIDGILDALGEPGDPVREAARLHDPQVQALRDMRNVAVRHLDAERSVWQTRATLIARTESTGAANYGAWQALAAEGVQTKVWLATGDSRTRPTHAATSGQEVRLAGSFQVGASLLRFPGDPAGPVDETASCRCAMIAGGALRIRRRV